MKPEGFAIRPMSTLCITLLLIIYPFAEASYEDSRCKCECNHKTSTDNTGPVRNVIIEAMAPEKCNTYCKDIEKECPNCVCKFQVRNTTTIKVVVCLIITIISALTLYMVFLLLLEPLLAKRRGGPPGLSSGAMHAVGSGSMSGQAEGVSSGGMLGPGAAGYTRGSGRWGRFPSSGRVSGSQDGSGVLMEEENDQAPFADRDALSSAVLHMEPADPNSTVASSGREHSVSSVVSGSATASGVSGAGARAGTRHRTRSDPVSEVVSRARDQQKKWKGAVEAQRVRVFNEHSILN